MAGVPAGARGTGCSNDKITSGRRSRIENHNIHFSHYRHTNDQTRTAALLDHARACRCVMRRADGPRGRTPNLNKNNDKRPAEKTAVDCTPGHGAIACRGWIARFAASLARRRPQTDGDDAQSLPRHRVGQHARCAGFPSSLSKQCRKTGRTSSQRTSPLGQKHSPPKSCEPNPTWSASKKCRYGVTRPPAISSPEPQGRMRQTSCTTSSPFCRPNSPRAALRIRRCRRRPTPISRPPGRTRNRRTGSPTCG